MSGKRVCMTGPRAIFNPLKPETHFTITFSSMKEATILACSVLHKEEIQNFKLQLTLKFNYMHFPSTYNLDSVWPSPLTDSYCLCR